MITAKATLKLHVFGLPLSLTAAANGVTIFEGHTDFDQQRYAPNLDKVLKTVCDILEIDYFLKTDVQFQSIYARYELTARKLYLEAKINLPNSLATLTVFLQPSAAGKRQDFAAILDLRFAFDLADLPILPKDSLDEQLRLTLAFANFNGKTTVEKQNFTLKKGVQLQPNIQFPNKLFEFDYELMPFEEAADTPVDLTDNIRQLPQLPHEKSTKWFELNQGIGGLNFRKLGVQWKDNKVFVLLNADYLSAGLEFALLGLQASSSLDFKNFKPKFDLHGIGVHFKNELVEVGGALLREPEKSSYLGKVLMRFAGISVGAVGGFGKTETDENSFFAFANINVPIGGVPAFFVKGLAAGFGYNSHLNLPEATTITEFPLLNVIETGRKNPSEALAYLGGSIVPKTNEKWLAAGVKFSSFNLIDAQAVLIYEFSKRQIALIGEAQLILPDRKAAFLNLQLGFKATYQIATGELRADAVLTENTFLIHKNVRLSGGMACYAWFKGEHAGDFLLSIGGYHPRFQRPAHFPELPKVGFNWAVSDSTRFEGNVYFALTQQAIMTGFNFNATYEKNKLKAWFAASTDMVLQWKPFYYDFHTKIQVGAIYQSALLKNYKLDVGADLHLFGPEMGGYAQINWTVISFQIRFGNPEKANFLYVLDWGMFKNAFLPLDSKEICRATLSDGLIAEEQRPDGSTNWLVHQNSLAFATQSLIPSNRLIINNKPIPCSTDLLGVRPMNKQYLKSTQRVRIIKKSTATAVEIPVDFKVKYNNFPTAMWSPKPLNQQNLKLERINAAAGFELFVPLAKQQTRLAKAKKEYFEGQKMGIKSRFEAEMQPIESVTTVAEKPLNSLAQSLNATATVAKRQAIVDELNSVFAFANTEKLWNETLTATESSAEQIYQSEPKIGKIQISTTVFAKAKQQWTETITAATTSPQLPTFGSRSIKATEISTKVTIKVGAPFVFKTTAQENKIEFLSETAIQVLAFDAAQRPVQYSILPKTATTFVASEKTEQLTLLGLAESLKPTKFTGWRAAERFALINPNALLSDGFMIKMQVPMTETDEVAASVSSLSHKNYIQTETGKQKGFIDTLFFEDYRTVIVIVSNENQGNLDLESIKNSVKMSIPFTFDGQFERHINAEAQPLKLLATAMDTDGNLRLKFSIANKKLGKKSESDPNFKAFVLRIESKAEVNIEGCLMFKKFVCKRTWRKV